MPGETAPHDPFGGGRDSTGHAPSHPGPPEGWRPLSGLALSAFVASLVLALVTPVLVLVQAIPLFLGLLALLTVDPERRRGRPLAAWAMGIAIVVGGVCYVTARELHGRSQRLARQLVGALADREGDLGSQLEGWFTLPALEGGVPERVRERYARLEEELGRFRGELETGSVWFGFSSLLQRPEGLEEVGKRPDDRDLPVVGSLWVEAVFERGRASVAIVLAPDELARTARVLGDLTATDRPARIVQDLRFLRRPVDAPPP
jgi:hypothetical protein